MVIIISLVSVWPMVINPSRVPNYGTDGELLIWIMNQKKLFDGNIFYPYKNTLAYSDRMLLSQFTSRLSVLLTGNPGVAFGVNLVLGQVLTLVIIYLFWVYEFKNPATAVMGVAAFALSQIRMEYQVHLQMWNMQYWLLGTLLLWSKPKPWQMVVGFILLGLQFWESPLPVYFALLVIGARYLVFRYKINKHHVLGFVLMVLIIFPMARAYINVSREFGITRDIREAAHNAISIDDLWGHFMSPALFVLFLIALPKLNLKDAKVKAMLLVLVISFILALGPALKWQGNTVKIWNIPIPLPYAVTYYLVPGFSAFRTPSRWLFVSGFAASGLIAFGLSKYRLSRPNFLLLMAIVFLTGKTVNNIRELPTPNSFPVVYKWLKDQPGQIILEMPRYTWAQEDKLTYRMYYSLLHNKSMVDGYSGFTPPQVTPLNIDYTIVHLDEGASATIEGTLVWQNETTLVYSHN